MRRLVVALLVVALLLSISVATIAAAPPVDKTDKGPPDLAKLVFVHYPKGLEAKGGIPGAPDKLPKPDDGGKLWYKYSGIHWVDPTASYFYNSSGGSGDYISAIQAGFNTWENVEGAYFDFEYVGTTSNGISSLNDETDGYNVVGWADLDYYGFSNAIAVTMVWYNPYTGLIVEIDMAFSNNTKYSWHIIDPGETWDDTSAYDVDVQNIATHEVGHWLMLGDMYNKPASNQTMYGISAEFELQKRSLESGDKAGIIEIYPAT